MKIGLLNIVIFAVSVFHLPAMADEDAKHHAPSVKARKYDIPKQSESELRLSSIVFNLTQAYTDKGGKIAVVSSSFDALHDNELVKEISRLDIEVFKEKFSDKKDLFRGEVFEHLDDGFLDAFSAHFGAIG